MTTVTVCVVVKDRRDLMMRCLDAIAAQDHPADEVVVVDNGSTDGTLEALHERAGADPRLRVIVDAGSLGHARNTAVREAHGDVVAFTDSDCSPRPGWLRAGLAALADPEVVVVQGRTVPERTPTARWSATQDIDRPGLYEACNVFYRRASLLATRGFDADIGFFGEDTAAGWAVLQSGGRSGWASQAIVEHVVTTPGLLWHLRRTRGYANWPVLIRRFPEQRQLLWHSLFLRRASAETDLLLVGLAASALSRRAAPLAATFPFLWSHRPRGRTAAAAADSLGRAAFDIAVSVALLRGSIRERTMVL